MKTHLSLLFVLQRRRKTVCILSIFLLTIISPLISFAQQAPPLDWQKKFGGTESDVITSWAETDDGYLIGGLSQSGVGGDKTTPNKGDYDYWVIKTDKNGNKLWDKSFGGSSYDELNKIIKTNDGGFLLAGKSNSEISDDKSESSRGDVDFWVIRISANGTKLWDHTFGGNAQDDLKDAIATSDGGFLLGGNSYSDQNGDKSEPSRSNFGDSNYSDYWVVKIDVSGVKQWDKTLGGNAISWSDLGHDFLTSVVEAKDGGFLIGGHSTSLNGNEKSDDILCDCQYSSEKYFDYWIVKLNTNGQKEWDKTLGGFNDENLSKIIVTDDAGYLLIGTSNSRASGNKTLDNPDPHIWLIRISDNGDKRWERIHTGQSLASIASSPSGYYLSSFTNTTLFLTKYNWRGNVLWTKSIEGGYSSFGFIGISKQEEVFLGATAPVPNSETNYQVYKLKAELASNTPHVELDFPANVKQGASLVISAENIISQSSVSKVEFYADNTKIGEDQTAPFKITLANDIAGVHYIYAKVIESSGTSFVSATEILTVSQSDTEFYRAINLNGREVILDGIKFESSNNAPGFTFQAKAFANQSVPLIPDPGAPLAELIRSSLYATTAAPATFTFANVKYGAYEVYVYSWEDNYSATYSLWVEGQQVLENYQSGHKGNWVKHGPFKTIVYDETLEIKATGGDAANISAIEIRKVTGVEFYRAINLNGPALKIDNVNFESSSNTTNFTYEAKAFANQSVALTPKTDQTRATMIRSSLYATKASPASFTFNNVASGTYDMFIYAWEDNYSQTFSITVNENLVLANHKSGNAGSWRKLGPFRTNVSDGMIKVGVSGGDANISGIELWKVTGLDFVRAINFNGPTVVIDNLKFESSENSDFTIFGAPSYNGSIPLIPATDANRASMIRSSISATWSGLSFSYASLPAGVYDIYYYILEDNAPQDYTFELDQGPDGSHSFFHSRTGNKGEWNRVGPIRATTTRYGLIFYVYAGDFGSIKVSGLEIWSVTDASTSRIAQSLSPSTSSLRFEASKSHIAIAAFPNPVSNQLMVQLPGNYKGKVAFSLIDGIGINYLTENRELKGENHLTLDLPVNKMSTGLYFLKIKYEGKEEIIRLSKE